MALTKIPYSMIKDSMISVVDYGADPTGTTDSTAAINSAIQAGITSNKTVYIPSGTYKYDGYEHSATDAFEVSIIGEEGNEPVFIPSQTAVDAGNYMMLFPATTYTNVTGLSLSASIYPGQATIALTSATGLSAGMVIRISSDRLWYNGNRGVKYCGEIHRINSINGNTITIDDFVRDEYLTSETLTIVAWNPCKVTLKNLRFEAPYPATVVTSVGVMVQQSVNSVIENVHCSGFITRCFGDSLNINAKFRDIECHQNDDMPTATTGYGLAVDGSLGTLVDGFNSVGQRRAFDADGYSENSTEAAVARDWMVTNFDIHGGGAWYPATVETNYGLGMHGPSENGIFCNGFISDVQTGINARGRSTTVDNVVFSGPMVGCVALYENGAGLTVKNCTYDSFGYPNKVSNLELVDDTTGCDYFVRCGIGTTDTEVCYYDIPIVIQNNTVKGAIDGFVILYYDADTPNPYIENIYITGNQVEAIAGTGQTFEFLKAAGASTIVNGNVSNNTMKSITGTARWFDTDFTVGTRTASSSYTEFIFNNSYYVTIDDDTVVNIPYVDRTGERLMVSVMERNGSGYIFRIIPETASTYTTADIANTQSYIDITATGSSMTGTTGTDGLLTFGLMNDAGLWIQNRLGSQKSFTIQVL